MYAKLFDQMAAGGVGGVVALALCLVACQASSHGVRDKWFGNITPPSCQTLVYENYTEPMSLDPAIADSTVDSNIVASLFEGLVQNNPLTAQPMAALATHYEASPNGMQFTFYLRGHPHPPGTRLPDSDTLPFEYSHGVHAPPDSLPARWSDGTVVTARDFVYAWQRAVDPKTAAPVGSYLSVVKNAQRVLAGKVAPRDLGVRAPDDFTFVVDLEEPAPYLLSLMVHLVFRAVPQDVVEQARRSGHGDNWARPGTIVTSGPFTLEEWRPYELVRVRRSPTYYQADLVKLDEITFVPITSGAAVTNLYRFGATHVTETASIPESLTPALLSKRDFHADPLLGVYAYSINTRRPPFNNVLLRYALNMSLDKTAIGRYLNSRPAKNLAPPLGGYQGPQSLAVTIRGRQYNVLEYNPVAARELLAMAGYPNGIGSDGRPLTFDLRAWNGPTYLGTAEIVGRQWFTNLNIRARLSPAEFDVAIPEMRAGDFSIIDDSWAADFLDPLAMLTPTYVTDASGGWTDSEYLALLNEANRTTDPLVRFKRLARAETRLMQEMPIIPLVFEESHTLEKPYIRALHTDPLDAHYFRYTWIDTRWKP